MYISLNWIRDFVSLPLDVDIDDFEQRITCTTAEIEKIKTVDLKARGLICARVEEVKQSDKTPGKHHVVLNTGGGKTVETVTAAPVIHVGKNLLYAPAGSSISTLGDISITDVGGITSSGMILPGESVGIEMAMQEAVFLSDACEPGTEFSPELFNDVLVEFDNKSLTHRPDLWGHFGMAREIAAVYRLDLTPPELIDWEEIPFPNEDIPISIADSQACRRYSCMKMSGVSATPAPLWMQLRLGRIGMRPISSLVDLTNFIMVEIGQPMHAFDADKVNKVEVDWAEDGESFQTLDGEDHKLTSEALMIKSNGKSIAMAGVMGGLETEVSDQTESLLLESANFDPTVVRKTALAYSLRTEASARFEKSLDPENTEISIKRFVKLAKDIFPGLTLESSFSDDYPNPYDKIQIEVSPERVGRIIGRTLTLEQVQHFLDPLEFEIKPADTEDSENNDWLATVPSFRATSDVSIEEDVIEEIARHVGYGSIEPQMPLVHVRNFEPNAIHAIEKNILKYFSSSERFHEIHGYLWYNQNWLDKLEYDPGDCVELANPAAEGLHRMRQNLLPGLLASVEKNRFYFPSLSIMEVGSVYRREASTSANDSPYQSYEYKNLGLVKAARGKKIDIELIESLKGSIERFFLEVLHQSVEFESTEQNTSLPWENETGIANIITSGQTVGRLGTVGATLRHRIDEHMVSWGIAWAELSLEKILDIPEQVEALGVIPAYPVVHMDFSLLVPKNIAYKDFSQSLQKYEHALLMDLTFADVYEGKSIPDNMRSITVRAAIGDENRTLEDNDSNEFRHHFANFIAQQGYDLR